MKAFGFLSFGHYGPVPGSRVRTAGDMLRQTVELAEGADEIGVNGAYVRVHHFARQAASPIPLLTAMAARTQRIEVGTGVIDMRYENPLYLAEELAALDLLADQRIAIGISRGSPETALRGYEAFGYGDRTTPAAPTWPATSSTPSCARSTANPSSTATRRWLPRAGSPSNRARPVCATASGGARDRATPPSRSAAWA